MDKTIIPGAVEGEVDPPSSKSYAQRAIAANFLAGVSGGGGGFCAVGAEECDDTAAALRVVEQLGAGKTTIDIGESGLATRLFTPIAAMMGREVTITGRGSILKRPMGMMTEPLRELGVEVVDNDGFLPITVKGPMRGGSVEIDGSVSSQFLTGLLMALPLAAEDTTIRVRDLKSIPYVNMTLDVMDAYGIDIDHRDYEEFYVPGGQEYKPCEYEVEGDWSAAACLLVAGAVAGGMGGGVTVRNLRATSLQADVAIVEALSRAGARVEQLPDSVRVSPPMRADGGGLRAFEFDATDCPDLFPALAALAASCEGTTTIIGTKRLVHKECNRAEAIWSEFEKMGIEVDIEEENVMRIRGGERDGGVRGVVGGVVAGGVAVESHGDHRMAMSLAVTALNATEPVVIRGTECVAKSYAAFWDDFDRLRNE